jgi:type I restriction enzyme S subunit
VGEIPEDWDLRAIGDSYEFKNGLNKEKKYFGYGTPIVNYMDVYSYPGLKKADIRGKVDVTSEEKRAYSAKKGDVFFTRTSETVDEIGMASTLLEEVDAAVFSGFILRARPRDVYFDLQFQKYCFNSKIVRRQIKSTSSYTTRALTNGRLLSAVFVPTPIAKSEQKAIAKALSDVDELIVSLEKLIAKKRDIKTATMQQLLTGKKRLQGFGEGKGTKQTELGEIPEDWEVEEIGQLLSITTGNKNTQDKVVDGKYPFFVRSQIVEKINSYSFDGEAVLTAGDGVGTGKIFHYINGKLDFHQRVYLMHKFNEKLNVKYFYIYFSNHFYDRIMSMTAKSSVDSVRREMITKMKIVIPPITEQDSITEILFDMNAETQLLERQLNKTKSIKQAMMQELLTGRTRLIDTQAHYVEQERMHGT